MTYLKIEFNCRETELKEILIAKLSEAGFEGFEEDEFILKAFIPKEEHHSDNVSIIAKENNITFTITEIPDTNWNKVWESNFQPVIIEDFVSIRTDFHSPIKQVEHEIIINPKMSFGTGHHETTHMMIQQMQDINFKEKTVLDFGTGTGILAILAEKLGAVKVIAVDNDQNSIENASENIAINKCSNVFVRNESTVPVNFTFDIILANITRNVIIENLDSICKQLNSEGIILLSGLLNEDVEIILQEIRKYSVKIAKQMMKKDWISLRLEK